MKKIHFFDTKATLAGLSLAWLLGAKVMGQIPSEAMQSHLDALRGEDYAARYEARMAIQDAVAQTGAKGESKELERLELQLAELAASDLPLTTRLWMLRQLNLIGSDASVDTLAGLLDDQEPKIAEAARMALDRIPGRRSSRALLGQLEEEERSGQALGLIDALKRRGYRRANREIAKRLRGEDVDIVRASVVALGELGGGRARRALTEFRGEAPKELEGLVELSLLKVAGNWRMAEGLLMEGSSAAARAAAFRRAVELRGRKAAELMNDFLQSGQEQGRGEILRIAMLSGEPALVEAGKEALTELSPASQSVVLGALAAEGDRSAEALVQPFVDSENETLQLQAVEALGKVGTVSSLSLLMDLLDSSSRDLREAALQAIALLEGDEVDQRLLAQAREGELKAIQALSARNSEGAVSLLNQLASGEGSEALREAALAALEEVGDGRSLPILVDLIVTQPARGGLRRDAQIAFKRLSLRQGEAEKAWHAFAAGLEQAAGDAGARLALLQVADAAPTPEAISFLRKAWATSGEEEREAILRVLPSWPNWDGGYLLLEIAQRPGVSEEARQACYRGIGRLVLASDLNYSMEGRFDLAGKALEAAETEEEKRAVLDGFRNASWRERNFATQNEVHPELKRLLAWD